MCMPQALVGQTSTSRAERSLSGPVSLLLQLSSATVCACGLGQFTCRRTSAWAPSRFTMVRWLRIAKRRSGASSASPCHTPWSAAICSVCCCDCAGYTASQLFGAGVSYTYDDVIMHPGHISFGAHEVCKQLPAGCATAVRSPHQQQLLMQPPGSSLPQSTVSYFL